MKEICIAVLRFFGEIIEEIDKEDGLRQDRQKNTIIIGWKRDYPDPDAVGSKNFKRLPHAVRDSLT